MKRSEAIKLMIDTDKGYRMCVTSTGDYMLDQRVRMDNILKTLESAGMLPPSYHTSWLIENEPESISYETHQDYHLWEPEDDND